MVFELLELGYAYNSLEPYIDAKTMEIHHDKHHAGYVEKLNKALEGHEELLNKPVEELIKNIDVVSDKIKVAVMNNGGGHFNHSMFWLLLKKDVAFEGEIAEAINKNFGSFEGFKSSFSEAAITQFGSGWAWLVVNPGNNKLEIVKTSNQENPLSKGKIPVLCIDVWEHAYYLKYQNKKADYVEAFFNVINWEQVNKNYLNAIK